MLSGKQTLLIAATAVMLLAIIIYMVAKRKKWPTWPSFR